MVIYQGKRLSIYEGRLAFLQQAQLQYGISSEQADRIFFLVTQKNDLSLLGYLSQMGMEIEQEGF